MKTNLQNELLNKYTQKRNSAIATAKQNFNNALKDKVFAENYKKIRDLDFEIAKKESSKQNAESEKQERKLCKQKINDRAKQLKINTKSFVPKFECELCKDTGFINGKMCECFRTELNKAIINACGIKIDETHNFENFKSNLATLPEQADLLQKLKIFFENYADKFSNSAVQLNVLLCGETGVGKTYVMECLANKLISKNISLNFVSAFQMNDLFIKYHTTFTAEKSDFLSVLTEPDVLLIDDLGTEPINKNVTKEYLYTLISERMNSNKATLISTNLMPQDILSTYGERIFSRLLNKSKSALIRITGEDLRLKKQ